MMRENRWKRKKKRKMTMKNGRFERKEKTKQNSELKKTRMRVPGLY
jgi:hypothetical protein